MNQAALKERHGLEQAFQTFNQLSEQLTASYQQLENRVAGLSAELAASHDARIQELTEKERLAKRLELLLNVLPGGVVVLDGQGVIQECNPAALDMLGSPLLGKAWDNIIQRAFVPQVDDGHDLSLVDGRRVNLSTCPLGSESGQILLLTDVSEMHQLQERLNHQHRLAAMGETAASLAHQIRTPLASALLYASNLKLQKISDGERVRVSEKIFARLRHLEELVNNMLLYARGMTVRDECFSVGEILDELRQIIEPQLTASETVFEVINAAQDQRIQGNRQMFVSALMNLCVNAIQAMKRGGMLKIIIQVDPLQNILFNICDNGPGIELSNVEQIFEPFYTTREEGTGLGLAVVKAIVTSHNGEIRLDTEQQKGCCFCIKIPVYKPAGTNSLTFKEPQLSQDSNT